MLIRIWVVFIIKTISFFSGRSPPARSHQHGGVSDLDVRRRQRICESRSGHLWERLGHRADAAEPQHHRRKRAGVSRNEVSGFPEIKSSDWIKLVFYKNAESRFLLSFMNSQSIDNINICIFNICLDWLLYCSKSALDINILLIND